MKTVVYLIHFILIDIWARNGVLHIFLGGAGGEEEKMEEERRRDGKRKGGGGGEGGSPPTMLSGRKVANSPILGVSNKQQTLMFILRDLPKNNALFVRVGVIECPLYICWLAFSEQIVAATKPPVGHPKLVV